MRAIILILKTKQDKSVLKLLKLFQQRKEIAFNELVLKIRKDTFYESLRKLKAIEDFLVQQRIKFFIALKKQINGKTLKYLQRQVIPEFVFVNASFAGVILHHELKSEPFY
ncbi:hypothetical protein HZA97_02305 [Candidatus Woesearchaeota archaeon]|nr:hypothetical protein [Candidatus Woesearchaeota archaeon]